LKSEESCCILYVVTGLGSCSIVSYWSRGIIDKHVGFINSQQRPYENPGEAICKTDRRRREIQITV
jgi:hypothetical protein